MDFNFVNRDETLVVGISARTSNKDGRAAQDLYKLWDRFFKEGVNDKIQNSVDNEILNIYTDYENSDEGEYTVIVGKKVSYVDKKKLPKGLVTATLPASRYAVFTAQGKLPDCVQETWELIHALKEDLNRTYTGDFDVYGPKTADPSNAEVEIYVAIE